MEYRFTNTDSTRVAMDLALDEMAWLRKTLESVLKADLADVSQWRLREMIEARSEAQRKASEVMVYEASALADAAKPSDDI